VRWPRRASDQRAALSRVTAALVAVTLFVGCGIAKDPLAVAIGDAASAGSSSALALEQHADGRLTTAAAQTMIDDARRELAGSAQRLSDLSTSGRQSSVQAEAVTVLARTVQHVHEARRSLGSADAEQAAERLRQDAGALEKLEERAERAG